MYFYQWNIISGKEFCIFIIALISHARRSILSLQSYYLTLVSSQIRIYFYKYFLELLPKDLFSIYTIDISIW